MVTDTIPPPWVCAKCGQLNSPWAARCGRCDELQMRLKQYEGRIYTPVKGDAVMATSAEEMAFRDDRIRTLEARLAEAERAILDLWRGQIRCGYSCNRSDNAAHVNGKVWGDVASRFQHIINPERAADRAEETP